MKPAPAKADQDAVRLQLNLKNLRRHDPSIDQILGSTSYATIYYNEGADWTKTNIEGPLFIFSRTETPKYGFFVLNRNGLDYVKEFLTVDTEVKMEGQFILIEPRDAERAAGIWVFEEKERIALTKRMQTLCTPAPTPVKPVQTMQKTIKYNESIPIDFLFASANSSNMMPTGNAPPVSAPPAPAPAPTSAFSAQPTGMQLLESMFKSASQPRATPSPQPPVAQSPPSNGPPRDARALLAMIGHPGGAGYVAPEAQPLATVETTATVTKTKTAAQPTSPPAILASASTTVPITPVSPPSTTTGGPIFAPPLLSHDLFSQPLPKKSAPAAQSSVLPPSLPVESRPVPPIATNTTASVSTKAASGSPKKKERVEKKSNGTTKPLETKPLETKPLEKDLVLGLLDENAKKAGIGMSGQGSSHEDEPLSKKQFIEGVTAMLQNSGFSTKLYSAYLQRFSALVEEKES